MQARLRARLLGAPVLKIDGTVHVSPAHLVEPPRVVWGTVVPTGRTGSGLAAGSREMVPGVALAQAAKLLGESRRRLDHRADRTED